MIDSSRGARSGGAREWQGKPIVNSLSLKEGEADFLAKARAGAPLRRGGGGDGVR
jgi:cobalamin-dependent methionine synthase I